MSSGVWARPNIPQKPQMQLYTITSHIPTIPFAKEIADTNYQPIPTTSTHFDSPGSPAPSGVSSTVVLRVPLRRRRARSTVIAAGMSSWVGCITRSKTLGQILRTLAASMVITSQFKEELEPKSMTSGEFRIQDEPLGCNRHISRLKWLKSASIQS